MILLIVQFATLICVAQKDIVYKFDQGVIDSLQRGVDKYSALYKKPVNELKLYILLIEEDDSYNLYLQEYSNLPQSGFLQTISASNRKIRLSDKFLIPVLYPSDVLSEQLQKDKIARLPYSGYYLKVVTENYGQKVSEVAFLF